MTRQSGHCVRPTTGDGNPVDEVCDQLFLGGSMPTPPMMHLEMSLSATIIILLYVSYQWL